MKKAYKGKDLRVNIYILSIFILIQSCSSSENKKDESLPEEKVTVNKLKGRWQEEKDSLHIAEFNDETMKVFYGRTMVNDYPYVVFEGIPGQGGFESTKGRTIRIEESKDHYYNFLIIVLDSNYLELKHEKSDLTWFFKRLK